MPFYSVPSRLTEAVVVYKLCMEPLKIDVKQLDGLYRKPCQVCIGCLKIVQLEGNST